MTHFAPVFTITPAITTALMAIEAGRVEIEHMPVTIDLLQSLRHSAKLAATHYSTGIEGNRLTQEEVNGVINHNSHIPNKERDEIEVRNYYRALDEVERLATYPTILEEDIQRLHGLTYEGKSKPTPYRDGQNVIRDGDSGNIVYLPPEAKDVPLLMQQLVQWVNDQIIHQRVPIPIIAAIAHYQFATIHPYFDGNGRTARLLTTTLLHQNGYGLKGIYSLDEYYAQHLSQYYNALTVGHHNYYFGRADTDITGFIENFCIGMADAVEKVKSEAAQQHSTSEDNSQLLRSLRPQQKLMLELFKDQAEITSKDMADFLSINPRTARDLAKKWVELDFLRIENASKRARSYSLTDHYLPLINN